jgi:hypothetical protein
MLVKDLTRRLMTVPWLRLLWVVKVRVLWLFIFFKAGCSDLYRAGLSIKVTEEESPTPSQHHFIRKLLSNLSPSRVCISGVEVM